MKHNSGREEDREPKSVGWLIHAMGYLFVGALCAFAGWYTHMLANPLPAELRVISSGDEFAEFVFFDEFTLVVTDFENDEPSLSVESKSWPARFDFDLSIGTKSTRGVSITQGRGITASGPAHTILYDDDADGEIDRISQTRKNGDGGYEHEWLRGQPSRP
ncbi:MAG: hypothetical protein AAGI17_11095 [Planctomycetota bacterium]